LAETIAKSGKFLQMGRTLDFLRIDFSVGFPAPAPMAITMTPFGNRIIRASMN
jgi:hypothetical protein